MITTFEVILMSGERKVALNLAEVRLLLVADPNAQVNPVIRYTACAQHAAYEDGNCPICTSTVDDSP